MIGRRGMVCLVAVLLAVASLVMASLVMAPMAMAQDRVSDRVSDRVYIGEPVSMSLRDADLIETLRTFARLGDFNLIIHPGVRGKVTVELKDVPWDQAMEVILRMHGLGMEVTQNTMHVASPKALREMARHQRGQPGIEALFTRQVLRLTLDHVDAGLLARVLERSDRAFLSRHGRVEVDDGQQQRLVVYESRSRTVAVRSLIEALDVAAAAGENFSQLTDRADRWQGERLAAHRRQR